MTKQKIVHKKPSRHHWFLFSVFVVIIILGITAFVLQRSTNIKAIAGEAIQQTKQLALTDEAAVISAALQQGKENVFIKCPSSISPKVEQWNTPQGWNIQLWKPVEVQCLDQRIDCFYADSPTDTDRADQVVMYTSLKSYDLISTCSPVKSEDDLGCECRLAQDN
ncbi:MAG: hypothetical protein AABY40_02225 [Nanoarchaeota archaeon]